MLPKSSQTIDEDTGQYITEKLLPMWPDGWMKLIDIYSSFSNLGKTKTKDSKKPSSIEQKVHKTPQPSPIVPISKVTHDDKIVKIVNDQLPINMDKSSSVSFKEHSSKSTRNPTEKFPMNKTEKKQHHDLSLDISASTPITSSPYLNPLSASLASDTFSSTPKTSSLSKASVSQYKLKLKLKSPLSQSNNNNPSFSFHFICQYNSY